MASLTLNAVGDISLGDHPVCVGHGMRATFEKRGAEVFSNITPLLRDVDVNLCNIETVASDHGFSKYWLPSYEMRGNPKSLKFINHAGFNLFGVANNHSMQHGIDAFNDMVERITELKVPVIGLDSEKCRTKLHTIDHSDGTTSGIFAISIRPEEWTDRPVPYSYRENNKDLIEEVAFYRSKCTGFLICSIHWGLEFLDYPSPEQLSLGHALIDAGVDVVIGHHPHVLQPIERYKNGVIFYSLGNFAFDLWPKDTKQTVIAKINLVKGLSPDVSIIPIVIGDDFILRVANSAESSEIYEKLSWETFQNRKDLTRTNDEYFQQYKIASKTFRYSSYRYFLSNIKKYPANFLVQSLVRTGVRRLTGT